MSNSREDKDEKKKMHKAKSTKSKRTHRVKEEAFPFSTPSFKMMGRKPSSKDKLKSTKESTKEITKDKSKSTRKSKSTLFSSSLSSFDEGKELRQKRKQQEKMLKRPPANAAKIMLERKTKKQENKFKQFHYPELSPSHLRPPRNQLERNERMEEERKAQEAKRLEGFKERYEHGHGHFTPKFSGGLNDLSKNKNKGESQTNKPTIKNRNK